MSGRPQKGKGSKRPRRWHHSQAEGRRAAQPIAELQSADQRARTSDDELRAVAACGGEEIEVWQQLDHAAPLVPAFGGQG